MSSSSLCRFWRLRWRSASRSSALFSASSLDSWRCCAARLCKVCVCGGGDRVEVDGCHTTSIHSERTGWVGKPQLCTGAGLSDTHHAARLGLFALGNQPLVLVVEVGVTDGLLGGLQQLVRVHARKLHDAVLGQELQHHHVFGGGG